MTWSQAEDEAVLQDMGIREGNRDPLRLRIQTAPTVLRAGCFNLGSISSGSWCNVLISFSSTEMMDGVDFSTDESGNVAVDG